MPPGFCWLAIVLNEAKGALVVITDPPAQSFEDLDQGVATVEPQTPQCPRLLVVR